LNVMSYKFLFLPLLDGIGPSDCFVYLYLNTLFVTIHEQDRDILLTREREDMRILFGKYAQCSRVRRYISFFLSFESGEQFSNSFLLMILIVNIGGFIVIHSKYLFIDKINCLGREKIRFSGNHESHTNHKNHNDR